YLLGGLGGHQFSSHPRTETGLEKVKLSGDDVHEFIWNNDDLPNRSVARGLFDLHGSKHHSLQLFIFEVPLDGNLIAQLPVDLDHDFHIAFGKELRVPLGPVLLAGHPIKPGESGAEAPPQLFSDMRCTP